MKSRFGVSLVYVWCLVYGGIVETDSKVFCIKWGWNEDFIKDLGNFSNKTTNKFIIEYNIKLYELELIIIIWDVFRRDIIQSN